MPQPPAAPNRETPERDKGKGGGPAARLERLFGRLHRAHPPGDHAHARRRRDALALDLVAQRLWGGWWGRESGAALAARWKDGGCRRRPPFPFLLDPARKAEAVRARAQTSQRASRQTGRAPSARARLHGAGGGTHKGDALRPQPLHEARILRQKTVAGVHRLRARGAHRAHHRVDVEVGGQRGRGALSVVGCVVGLLPCVVGGRGADGGVGREVGADAAAAAAMRALGRRGVRWRSVKGGQRGKPRARERALRRAGRRRKQKTAAAGAPRRPPRPPSRRAPRGGPPR